MSFKNHKSFALLSLLVLAGLLAWGCASTSSVKKRTQEIEDKLNAQTQQLDQKISGVDAKAEEAKKMADDAWKKAEEAARSKGYAGYKVIGEREVNFDFDRYDLSKISKDILDEIGTMMQQKPELILEIAGHTDNIGPDEYNVILGDKRTESVRRYLADKFDIAIYRMFQISFGESKPKALNDTMSGQAANRRAVLMFLGPSE
ncbi:MAG: OmpA family protein [candidate division Zixibacteria bacterium]|nr:OmpA family protein [candidate division Zixibacteria bacterium]